MFGAIVHAKSRIPGPNMLAFNFAKPKEGRKLNGNIIKEILVASETHCQCKCLKEERCQSYNFATLENQPDGFVCQLSNSDRFRSLDNYTQVWRFQLWWSEGNLRREVLNSNNNSLSSKIK